MTFRNYILGFAFGAILVLPHLVYPQICTNAVTPPTTINGIGITATSTGSIGNSLDTASSCSIYMTPKNSIGLGGNGAFTYTMNFDIPINSFDFVLTRTGTETSEVFTFTTNTGNPTIIDRGSCFTTITNNVITSGERGSTFGGGGNFTVTNDEPYNTLTISGPGGSEGSFFALCGSSIVTKFDSTIEICVGDSVLIDNQFQSEPGYYVDTIFGGNSTGGDSIIIINLLVHSISVDLGNDTTLCLGDTLTLDLKAPNVKYSWQDNSKQPSFHVTQKGEYWVNVTENNCSNSDTIQVNYNPSKWIDLGRDATICQGESFVLNATMEDATYLWQDSSMEPINYAYEQGTYWVDITVNNCSISDTINIYEKDCEINFGMPNVFTPNNDGINDLFMPVVNKGIVSMQTTIYNRWGVEVFQTKKLSVEWDGYGITEGTYFWLVNYTDINGKSNKLNGIVSLLR